ncbi:MAG TPA: hypothetical protein VGE45_01000 [Chloroflexia bacterium]|jgi:hypothetical protein
MYELLDKIARGGSECFYWAFGIAILLFLKGLVGDSDRYKR